MREKQIERDAVEGIRPESTTMTLNDMYDVWKSLKKELKPNTLNNYKYMYDHFVKNSLGQYRLKSLKITDIRRFYNKLVDVEGLKVSSLDTIQLIIHQVLDLAVQDDLVRKNVSNNGLRELKRIRGINSTPRKALTVEQQNLFLKYLRNSEKYKHWYPTFVVMLGTGLRVGELTGLRWEDIDFQNNLIKVNHTLVFYERSKSSKTGYGINTPKTKAGYRTIPMIKTVREALQKQQTYLQKEQIRSVDNIDGFRDFIFLNRFGHVQNQGPLNKALKRIIRDCNFAELDKNPSINNDCLLPNFSCHVLRHTFTTRLVESGMNVKVIQNVLGHSDIQTTLNIYADVTRDMKNQQFNQLEDFISKNA
ncbi:site-specific integrase [Limosilactobacillus reuteri]